MPAIRVRIRVWWLMIVVAVAALAIRGMIWAELMERRALYFRGQADRHGALAAGFRRIAEVAGRPRSRAGRLAEFHEGLSRAYDRAAANPWSEVPSEPDPPE